MDSPIDTASVARDLREFSHERDWDRFHTPKNLSMAVAAEAGELLEVFQWLDPEESSLYGDSELRGHVAEELADILIYAIRMADILDIDLAVAIDQKIQSNRRRYPADEVKGRAVKRQ